MAIVILSGGQDSTTCLYWAIKKWGADQVEAVTFDYGQRHSTEIAAAREIAEDAGVSWRVVNLRGFGALSKSALTNHKLKIEKNVIVGGRKLPSTFVPGRNLVFMAVAAGLATTVGTSDLVLGVCQTDYSGYPDCRQSTITAFEAALRLGLGDPTITIHTPLMNITKAESVALAQSLPGCIEALAKTVTCYHGSRPGCGECPSCVIRANGFREAGVVDPGVHHEKA